MKENIDGLLANFILHRNSFHDCLKIISDYVLFRGVLRGPPQVRVINRHCKIDGNITDFSESAIDLSSTIFGTFRPTLMPRTFGPKLVGKGELRVLDQEGHSLLTSLQNSVHSLIGHEDSRASVLDMLNSNFLIRRNLGVLSKHRL